MKNIFKFAAMVFAAVVLAGGATSCEEKEEGILQMARNMKQQGLSLDIIQRVTGLSSDVCESL